MEALMFTSEEVLVEVCADELWGGVYCTLPPGHAGSHESSPSHDGGCALTWRAKVTQVTHELPSNVHLDSFLKMVRSATAHR
jgi:hypothetical protein